MEGLVTNKNLLHTRISAYSAAACALIALGTTPARAQVNYSGEQNLLVDLTDSYLELDLDGDLVNDFGMYFDSIGNTITYNSLILKYVNRFGAMVNLRTDSYQNSWITTLSTLYSATSGGAVTSRYIQPVVARLAEKDTINSFMSGWGNTSYVNFTGLLGASINYTVEGPIITFSSADSRGRFPAETGFVGVRFYIGTERHYGWIRVQLSEDMESMTIMDWAWESTPDAQIEAGATPPDALPGNPVNRTSSEIRIYPNPAQEILYIELDKTSDIQIFDPSGRLVYSRKQIRQESLSVKNFMPGLYLLYFHNPDGNFTRRVILR